MPVDAQDEILLLTQQCKDIEQQLADKRNQLEQAIIRKLTDDGKQHPMSSFIGQLATYDRPHKWGKPQSRVFKEEDVNSYKYLKFNGIVSGDSINSLYSTSHYKKTAQFYSFVIPEEYADDLVEGQPVPMKSVYELLIFEIR